MSIHRIALIGLFLLPLLFGSCGEEKLVNETTTSENAYNSDVKFPKNVDSIAVKKSELEQIEKVTYLNNSKQPFTGYAQEVIKGVKNILQFKDGWVVRHVTFYSNGLKEKDISFRPKSVEMNKYLNPPRGTKRGKFSEWHRNGKKKTEFHYDDSGLQIGTQTIWHTDGTKIAQTTYEINDGKLRPQKRCDPLGRIGRLRSGGGKPSTAVTVIKGLRWLQSIQDDDGGWGNQDRDREGKPFKNNGLQRDALTALSLIAYLSHCELPDSPEFGDTVQRGIDFLTSTPSDKLGKFDSNGEFIGLDDPDNDGSFSHPLRAYALCKAYTFTKFPELKELAVKAIRIVLGGQNPNGGWAPGFDQEINADIDLTITGWCLDAIRSFALTGIARPSIDECFDKAVEYIKTCQNESGTFSYHNRTQKTSNGVWFLQNWKNAKSKEAVKGLDWIIQNQEKNWEDIDIYEWHYRTRACFQSTAALSGKYWRNWNKKFQDIVSNSQNIDGSWPPGRAFKRDSLIYRSILSILTLEVFYRYTPMTKRLP